MPTIAIIGSGLSGKLLAINLLKSRHEGEPVDILLIDKRPATDMGPAYSCAEECLLLNVPAVRMGAFSQDKGHFYQWAVKKNSATGPYDFLPRKWYNQYIQEILQLTLAEKNENIHLKTIEAEVTDITITPGKAAILLKDGTLVHADKVVLALGNFPPRNLPLENNEFIHNEKYISNPWNEHVIESLAADAKVGLIGTGQTTVDILMKLHHQGHRGSIFAISRRGHLPLVHTGFEPYRSFYEEIRGVMDINKVFKTIRKHFQLAQQSGSDANAVIDSLRPHTQELWMTLSLQDKKRFMRHLYRYWEMIRSRIPPENMAIIHGMLASGQLRIIAARIKDISPFPEAIQVEYSDNKGHLNKVRVDLLINTIGPETDYQKISEELITNLLQRGIIQPDPLYTGILAASDGAVINQNGNISDMFYTLGSPLRGILWETVGAPEIRDQAESLANRLLKT